MRCTSHQHRPGCNGECASQPRKLTHREQAHIDAYMDQHHPRQYPAPPRRTATLHVVTMGTDTPDNSGCTGLMTCDCGQCQEDRARIKPRSERNADPFRKVA